MIFRLPDPQSVADGLAALLHAVAFEAPDLLFPPGSWIVCGGEDEPAYIVLVRRLGDSPQTGPSRALSVVGAAPACEIVLRTPLTYADLQAVCSRLGWAHGPPEECRPLCITLDRQIRVGLLPSGAPASRAAEIVRTLARNSIDKGA